MPSPFRLTWRLLIAGFKIAGYSCVFVVQSAWYIACRRWDQVGDAIGDFGRGIVDALADVVA